MTTIDFTTHTASAVPEPATSMPMLAGLSLHARRNFTSTGTRPWTSDCGLRLHCQRLVVNGLQVTQAKRVGEVAVQARDTSSILTVSTASGGVATRCR